MTPVSPKVSVLMSAYNAATHIQSAINSVLNQTFTDWELLVIDDGSTDQTSTILQTFHDPRLRLLKNNLNIGLTKSLNLALRQARGEYVARLDADDLSLPERFSQQVHFLDRHPEIVLVGTLAKLIDSEGSLFDYQKTPTDPDIIKFSLLFGNPITHSSIMFSRKIVLDLGGYNEQFRYAQDFDLYSRLVQKHRIAILPELLVKYRRHSQSITLHQNSRQSAEDFALRTVFNNIQQYLAITPEDFLLIKQGLLIKNRPSLSPIQTLRTMNLLRRIWRQYLKKERLSLETIKKIRPLYHRRQKNILKRFLRQV